MEERDLTPYEEKLIRAAVELHEACSYKRFVLERAAALKGTATQELIERAHGDAVRAKVKFLAVRAEERL